MTRENVEMRSVRLPISGDVVQWIADGRWRMVSREQFDTEQSSVPRLPVVWNSPAELPDGVLGDRHPTGVDGSPGWHRSWGAVSGEVVEARYTDGCEAVVIIAGPLWVVESLDDVGTVDVAVGEPVADAAARRRVLEQMFDPPPKSTGSGAGGWWAWPKGARADDADSESRPDTAKNADDVDQRVRQGIAYLTWQDNSVQRSLHGIAEPDFYSCSVQPFGGHELPVEDGPDVPTLDEALAWARARTTTIIVRPEWDPGHEYRATDRPPGEWKRRR